MVPFYIYKKDPALKKWFLAPYLHLFMFLDPVRPIKSQNFTYPKSRLVCTQKKHIWTTVASSKQKKNRSSHAWEIFQKLPKYRRLHNKAQYRQICCGFGKFSRSHELGLFFRLLRFDRGSSALVLSTNKPTFRITNILTFNGLDWI